MLNRTRQVLVGMLLTLVTLTVGCTNTTEGQVRIQTVRGQISQVIRPANGWVVTMFTVGDDYYDVDLKSITENFNIKGSTKDNAGVQVEIGITAHLLSDDDSVKSHVRKFGLDADDRKKRLTSLLAGQVNTEVKNAIAAYEAYGLLANQEAIQKRIADSLQPILKSQMQLDLESIQIIGRPDFVDDRIEQAASAVVANQKAKEAAEADLARAKVEAEKKQVEAQTFANPALLSLEKLRLQLEIERARADGIKGHNGPLTIVTGADTQLQLRSSQ
jgi:SPFH domain / Band 7 family